MASINKVIIIGNLGHDPELKFIDSGQAVCNFSVATTRKWDDKQGKGQKQTEWHRVTVWGKQAENCAKYLAKGSSCYVEGRLMTRKYTDKRGVDRWSTDVVAQTVQFLGGKGKPEETMKAPGEKQPTYTGPGDDNIPF